MTESNVRHIGIGGEVSVGGQATPPSPSEIARRVAGPTPPSGHKRSKPMAWVKIDTFKPAKSVTASLIVKADTAAEALEEFDRNLPEVRALLVALAATQVVR